MKFTEHNEIRIAEKTIVEQAAHLADVSTLTERQAEAYLRWYMSPDDVTNSNIADDMEISRGRYSELLNNARDIVTDEQSIVDRVIELITTTPAAPSNGITSEIIGTENYSSLCCILTKDRFDNTAGAQYHLYVIYQTHHVPEHDHESIRVATEWSIRNIEGDTPNHLIMNAYYHLRTIDDLDASNIFNCLKFISDHLDVSLPPEKEEELINEVVGEDKQNK